MKLKYSSHTHIEREIKCPYCDHEFHDSSELSGNDDGWADTVECESCGKKFEAECCVSVDHRTAKNCELNEQKHVWEKDESYASIGHYKCKNCDYQVNQEAFDEENKTAV